MVDSFEVEGSLKLGGLSAVKQFCDRLSLSSIVDDVIPLAPQGIVGHGAVFTALVMNKLHSSTPLYLVQGWAAATALRYLLKISPDHLNDDRLGRTLEAVADNAEKLKAQICHEAIREFGLDVGRLHWDLTSLEFHGLYEEQAEEFADVTFGYNSGGVGKKKQVRFGNLTCGDGAVSGLYHQTYSGNQNDQNTIGDHLHFIKKLMEKCQQPIRVVGDSKLASPEVMVDFEEAGLSFLFPEPSSKDIKAFLSNYTDLESDEWIELDYISQTGQESENRKAPTYKAQEAKGTIQIVEDNDKSYSAGLPVATKSGPKGGRPPRRRRTYEFRRLVVFSPSRRIAREKNRARRLGNLEEKLDELANKFQSSWWKVQKRKRAQAAVEKVLSSSKWGQLYNYELSESDEGWSLAYRRDEESLAEIAKLDGLYTLVTNIPQEESDACQVFQDYKGQNDAEKRFADWKHSSRVSSCFLKNNKRIVGMVFVLTIALLILCLIERHVRLQLPDGRMTGLLPVKKPLKATGWNILRRLDSITLIGVRFNGVLVWQPSRADPVQSKLLKMLRTDIVIPVKASKVD